MIFKIARTELRNLFYSPVAWFLLIAFFVQCAIFYTAPLIELTRLQDIQLENAPNFKGFSRSITQILFLSPDGVFFQILMNLYLFVPLLTMGLISREINNGTIKLLYSSPVTLLQIVLGKYLAVILYNLLLVAVVGIFVLFGIFTIRMADYGMLLSALFGFFLLISALSAIGIFMSSLTNYPIVSAIASFLLIFSLFTIGRLWQEHDLVRDITYYFALNGRTTKMMQGLITTNDVLYFLVIIGMFLAFTIIRLKGGRESASGFVKAGRYTLVVGMAILIGYATSRPGYIGYWDTTREKLNTINPKSQQILRDMGEEPVIVTLYTNLLGGSSSERFPRERNKYIASMWEPYLRFKPNIELRYEYFYDMEEARERSALRQYPGKSFDEYAALRAKAADVDISLFLNREQIREKIDLNDEMNRLVMKVEFKGKSMYLRTFPGIPIWPDEENVTAVLKRLSTSYIPRVYYVSGNWERSIYKTGEREYNSHSKLKINRPALINHGFESDSLSLDTQDIPANATTLVLADPRSELSELALNKIHQYLKEGGNMLILGEPGKQDVLNPVLQPLGVRMMEGTLVEVTKNEMPNVIFNVLTGTALNLAREPTLLNGKTQMEKPIPDTMGLFLRGATGISFENGGDFEITPLTYTLNHRNTWIRKGKLVTDSAAPIFNAAEGDSKQPVFHSAVALKRSIKNKEQRIIVVGDADFIANLNINRRSPAWFKGLFSWLDNNEYPKYVPRPVHKDVMASINNKTAQMEKLVLVWIIPAFILSAGTILLIRRKRQ